MTLTTERQQFAAQNEMSMEFVNWFFDEKKDGCGNAWFIMAAAMWEGWKGRANREAQPVGFYTTVSGRKGVVWHNGAPEDDTAIYTAPPAPAVPMEMTKVDAIDFVRERPPFKGSVECVQATWNSCRAAMLAQPVSSGYKLEGGENCWSCGKHFTYVQHSECDGYCPHCGSSVDIDDEEDHQSKVVPAEPTEEMISSAWREATGKCDHETIKRMYKTMLAAAPEGGNG